MGSTTNDAPLASPPSTGELDRLILAPAVGLAILVVVLCATVSLRVPLYWVAVPVQCLLAGSLAAVAWRWHRSRAARPMLGLGLLALLAGWMVLVDHAGEWLPNGADVLGNHADNWAFQAFADYFDRYRRGRVDGMPMIDEFGAHFANSRFAASALLAFLHHLPPLDDVPTARLVFCLLCCGVHFFSVLAFCRVCSGGANWLTPLLAASLATAGGWLGRVLMSANDDNFLFVSLVPAFLALCCAPRAAGDPAVRWRVVETAGIVFAAMIYNYPEGMELLGVLCLPLVVELGWCGVTGGFRPGLWLETGAASLLGVGLALPYLSTFVSFLHHEIGFGSVAGSRPGEGSLNGLLGGNRLAGAFALGNELPGVPGRVADNVLPLVLLALVALGTWRIARRLRWFPWVTLPLTGLCVWQNVAKQYDYGTFKILLMASWWTYPALSAGLLQVTERIGTCAPGRVALAGALLGVCTVKLTHCRSLAAVEMAARFQAVEEVAALRFVTGQSPALLALDDNFDYLWATYYLRDLPLGTRQQKGYLAMPHIALFLAQGLIAAPETCKYLLVAGVRAGALWRNSRFSLVPASPVYIEDIQNPANGLEMLKGRRFLWVGTQPATFRIFAARAGRYDLSATRLLLVTTRDGGSVVHLGVTDAAGTRTVQVVAGDISIPLTLASGENEVVLRGLDTPVPPPPGGDSRVLLLGVLGPEVVPAAEATP